MQISKLYTLYNRHPIVTTDSRHCPSGSIFFALKGESFDGNAFAKQALDAGCAFAVVDGDADVATSRPTNERIILVDNVLTTLQQLARLHRETLGIPVIAITGTNGKTTTKELVASVLSQRFNTLFTQGNLNNHIGVPLTLLRLTREHEMAVIEMGASHPGEIRELAEIARPDYGLITNVGYAHLEGFGSFENIVRTKAELYDFLRRTNGNIFINSDNDILMQIADGLLCISYGKKRFSDTDTAVAADANAGADIGTDTNAKRQTAPARFGSLLLPPLITGEILECRPFLSFYWKERNGWTHNVTTRFIGDYNLWNVLAAIAIGRYFDISPDHINRAIADYEPSNNRSQFKKTDKNELIIDAYNANPSSMQVALENFAAMETGATFAANTASNIHPDAPPEAVIPADAPSGGGMVAGPTLPKAVILGDMLELGEKSVELHAAVVAQLWKYRFDKVLLCGKLFTTVGKEFLCFPNVEAVNDYLDRNPLQNHRILIKGSRGIRLEKTIEKLS
jgi:UDP-N-acetylmuramoyl-tripeptide--D-alanyl-D-alanine ligase